MGFSFKVAPGIRIRASSRGLRAGIGPRIARVHVGSGRSGVSTGLGPVGFYSSFGGRRRRGSALRLAGQLAAGPSARSVTAARAQAARETKAAEAQDLAAAFGAILDLHRQHFPPAQRPLAPPVDLDAARRHYLEHEGRGLARFDRAGRRAAKARADAHAAAWAEQQVAGRQAELDEWWRRHVANDPDVVLPTLEAAFEDNEAPAAAVGLQGDEVSIIVLVPGPDAVPDRMPTRTAAGNLSLKRLSAGDRNGYYRELVAGYALVTVREALAVAPGIGSARVVAIRRALPDPYGRVQVECVFAARFARAALDGIRWDQAGAAAIVNAAAEDVVVRAKGAAKALSPIDLAAEPELAELVGLIDLGGD